MKQVNFSHSGGFPLEQETLEKLQTAYRSELYEALKRHLSIDNNNNYIVAHATSEAKGWAVIRQEDAVNPENQTGILYPINNGTPTNYLKTTRTETNLIYGTGESQPAYYDYEAEYSPAKYDDVVLVTENGEVQIIKYYDLGNFDTITDIHTIDTLLAAIKSNIEAIEANINVIEGNINAIETNIDVIEGDINVIEGNINAIETNIDIIEGDVNLINGYLERALVDSSTSSTTNLTLNYQSNWANTYVGGKVYLDNINTSTENFMIADKSSDSLLITDGTNQVLKSNNLLDSLLKRITKLETQPATAIPYGIVAIWGIPEPIPEGWEEYIPLKGKMPVGHQTFSAEEKIDALDGDGGNGFSYYRDYYGTPVFPFETLGSEGGRMSKQLSITEIPAHNHGFKAYRQSGSNDGSGGEAAGVFEDSTTTNTGGGQSFSILNPYKVVQFIVYTGRPKDITVPTNPTNLQVSNVSNTSVTLSWAASTDAYGVKNYIIYGNGILPIVTGNVLYYTVSGLSQDTSYNFYVKAQDAAENLSTESNTVNVRTTNVDTSIPTNFNGYLQSENEMYISWGAPVSPGVVSYDIWRRQAGSGNSSPHDTTVSSRTYYYDTGLFDTTYFYQVRALYNTGNYSGFTDEVGITTDPRDNQCFDLESLVTMASGQSKKLKNIVVGDKLQGFSFPNEIDESDGDYMIWNGKLNEASKAEVTVVNKITSVQPDYYEIKTADTTIKVTGQHPLLVTEDGENVQWVCVKNVLPDMLLIDKTGKTKAIESITFKEEPLEVAILDVENVDNYIISGIVAHNNKPEDPHDPQP
jgi:hypothetical protein